MCFVTRYTFHCHDFDFLVSVEWTDSRLGSRKPIFGKMTVSANYWSF